MLVLPRPPGVDGLLALDFYTREAGSGLAYTVVGELIRTVKYRPVPVDEEVAAGRVLTGALLTVLDAHPWLRSATHVVAPPGHDRRVLSLPERLADALADSTGRTRVRCRSRSAFRRSAKDMTADERAGLADEFVVDGSLTGATVLVVDDVVHHGTTVAATAAAARRADARSVLGLVVARNLRR